MGWKKELDTIFSEAIKLLGNWKYLPENTRVIVRDGTIIYMFTISERTLQELTETLAMTPAARVEFWTPDI